MTEYYVLIVHVICGVGARHRLLNLPRFRRSWLQLSVRYYSRSESLISLLSRSAVFWVEQSCQCSQTEERAPRPATKKLDWTTMKPSGELRPRPEHGRHTSHAFSPARCRFLLKYDGKKLGEGSSGTDYSDLLTELGGKHYLLQTYNSTASRSPSSSSRPQTTKGPTPT